MMSSDKSLSFNINVSFILIFIYSIATLTIFYKFQPDDTFIYLVYAKNFAMGNGITFNGMYVEGYSSVLWLYIISVLGKIFGSNNLLIISKILSLILFNLTSMLIYIILKKFIKSEPISILGSFLYMSIPSVIIWTAGALETSLYCFLLTILSYMLVFHGQDVSYHKWIGIVFVLIAMTRPEGIAFFGLMIIYSIYILKVYKINSYKMYWTYFIGMLLFLLWRYSIYGELLPITVYAKTGNLPGQIYAGLNYFKSFIIFYRELLIVFLIASIGCFKVIFNNTNECIKLKELFLVNITIVLGYTLFVLSTGGDWMIGYRFFVPIFSLLIILIILGMINLIKNSKDNKFIISVMLIVIAVSLNYKSYLIFPDVKSDYKSTYGDILMGKYLKDKTTEKDWVAVVDAGAIPYFTDTNIIDMLGLNNQLIAKRPGGFSTKYDNNYVLSYKPKYIQLVTMYSKTGQLRPVNFIGTVRLFFSNEFQANYVLDKNSPIPHLFYRINTPNSENIMKDYYNAEVQLLEYDENKNVVKVKLSNNGTGIWFSENNNNPQGCIFINYMIFNVNGDQVFSSEPISIQNDLYPNGSEIRTFQLPNLKEGIYKIEFDLNQIWVGSFKDKKPQDHIFYISKGMGHTYLGSVNELDLGNNNSNFYIKSGFSQPEQDATGRWRWSNGKESSIIVPPLNKNSSYNLALQMAPFIVPDITQSVEILLNDNYIGEIELKETGFTTYNILLPKEHIKDLNEVTFRYKYNKSPKEIYGSDDSRQLAVNFKRLIFKELQN